jgi:bacterial/archaeal transporter family-2 protein
MVLFSLLALLAGLCISLSRQINGRLALSTTPMVASFWNHLVGFGAICLVGPLIGDLFAPAGAQIPLWAWFGGPVGVIFVASGSWLIARIGAANTALLVIAGQMVRGVVLDMLTGAPGALWPRVAGVVLILCGMALTHRQAG